VQDECGHLSAETRKCLFGKRGIASSPLPALRLSERSEAIQGGGTS